MTLHLTMSLEEFLARPEVKPYEEYLHGRAVQKNMPSFPHSVSQAELSYQLIGWSREQNGIVVCEQRCALRAGSETYVMLPDVAYFPAGSFAKVPAGAVDVPPLLAVEILSPDDSYGRVQTRVVAYLEAGVKSFWIIDPVALNVTVHHPGLPSQLVTEVLEDPLLPGFTLELKTLFRQLL